MKNIPNDPPALVAAFDLIRQIYWDEYRRGYQGAMERALNAVNESAPVPGASQNIAERDPSVMPDSIGADTPPTDTGSVT